MKKLIAFCKRNPIEVFVLPISLIVWILSARILRWFDPSSGIYDAGVFQIIFFAIIQFSVFFSVTWIVFKHVFGAFGKYLKTDFKRDFERLDRWEKIKIVYSVFIALIFIMSYLSSTLK